MKKDEIVTAAQNDESRFPKLFGAALEGAYQDGWQDAVERCSCFLQNIGYRSTGEKLRAQFGKHSNHKPPL